MRPGEKHIYNSTKAVITCNNIVFKVSGKEVWKNGWKEFEDFFKNSYKTAEDKSDAEEEKKLPELREGHDDCGGADKGFRAFHTAAKKHYTEDSLCRQWSEPEQRIWVMRWREKDLAHLPPEPIS